MNSFERHLDIEVLSAYADGELSGDAVAASERHLSECERCRESLRRMRALVAAAAILPREVAPPPEVWSALRARVVRGAGRSSRPARWWHNGWLAAAAAVILVAGTAVLTMLTSTAPNAKVMSLPTNGVSRATSDVERSTSDVVLAVDGNYIATLTELRRTIETQRATLAPSTIRVLEHTIAVCDSAIAEARAALASDPANVALVEILSAQYERKVELLQRATRLSPSI